jgi:hypothetical protein
MSAWNLKVVIRSLIFFSLLFLFIILIFVFLYSLNLDTLLNMYFLSIYHATIHYMPVTYESVFQAVIFLPSSMAVFPTHCLIDVPQKDFFPVAFLLKHQNHLWFIPCNYPSPNTHKPSYMSFLSSLVSTYLY